MLLEFNSVQKSFPDSDGAVTVLRDVSFGLEAGQKLALTGESGSGKSTILHIASGLDAPDAGSVQVCGQDVTQLDDAGRAALRRNEVALIFQQFNLMPSLTVAANIAFQARLKGQVDAARIDHLIDGLGLRAQLNKYPEALSGGQQQMVAIGRALMSNPRVLLCDEISLGLAPVVIKDIYKAVPAIKAAGASLIVVEQDIAQAMAVADRVYCMMEGRVTLSGTPDTLSRAAIHDAYFGAGH